jgi:hypothetical protein
MSSKEQKIDNLVSAFKDLLDNQEANVSEISYINFKGDISRKGLLWSGEGNTKQFIYQGTPDKFFASETIDLAKNKKFSINNIAVLDEQELGPTVTKSNLREVGRLKGLIVDGDVSINQYLFYNSTTDRLGFGTDEPNAAVSICDQEVEIILGSRDYGVGAIGTYNSKDLEIVTDNTPRITIGANGNITLGNENFGPVTVVVQGTLGVNVRTPDPRTGLHVNGSIKFNDNIHLSGVNPPEGGSYTVGDITWNSNPTPNSHVGWVCVSTGNPGTWRPFGQIQ